MDTSTEEELTVELTAEERVLMMELIVSEFFRVKEKTSADVIRSCEAENSSNPKTSEFTREKREMIVKELIRDFFSKKNESKECFVTEHDFKVNLSPVEEKKLWKIFNSKLKETTIKSETKLNLESQEINNAIEGDVQQTANNDDVSNMRTRPSSRRHSQENETNIEDSCNTVINADTLREAVLSSVQDSANAIVNEDMYGSKDVTITIIPPCVPVNTDEELLEDYEDCTEERASERIEIVDLRSSDSSTVCLPEISTADDQDKIGLSEFEEAEILRILMLAEHVNDEKMDTDHEINSNSNKKEIKMTKDISAENVTEIDSSDLTYEEKVEMFLESCRNKSKRNSDSERDTESRRREIGYVTNESQEKRVDCDLSHDGLEDVKMKWQVNEDEITVNSREKDTRYDSTRVSTKEQFQMSWQRTKHKSVDRRSRPNIPMNDAEGPYYIDNKLVPTWIYQDGLNFSRWNPTQVLYEICSQCQWPAPEFMRLGYCVVNGFLVGVRVNDHDFIPKKRGHSKQLAKHYASAEFLHFLGFRFRFDDHAVNFSRANLKSYNTKTDPRYTRKENSEDSQYLRDTDGNKSLSRNLWLRDRYIDSRGDAHVKGCNINSRYNLKCDRSCTSPRRNSSKNYQNYGCETSCTNRHRCNPYLRMDHIKESSRCKYKDGQSSHKRSRSSSSSSSDSVPDRKRSYNYLTSTRSSHRGSSCDRTVRSAHENTPRHHRRTDVPSTSTGPPPPLSMFNRRGVSRMPPHIMQELLEDLISPSLEEMKTRFH